MAILFVNPTYQYKLGRDEELWWVGYGIAKSLVKKDGKWKLLVGESPEFTATCEVYLRGGFRNEITEELAAELVAAGYGDYIVYE
jgi:hypothetical protein